MNNLLLNCDIGESFGAWRMGLDAEVMPLIDCANIACGFHAGDPGTMRRTVALAVEHGVRIGAHPATPTWSASAGARWPARRRKWKTCCSTRSAPSTDSAAPRARGYATSSRMAPCTRT